ncbi:MAG: hypothetical protein GVY16_05780 [Planctomycetes bacterium]|jgi:hypothetical protein|nr:hypothetical protein [Planctomycetota bacterium]
MHTHTIRLVSILAVLATVAPGLPAGECQPAKSAQQTKLPAEGMAISVPKDARLSSFAVSDNGRYVAYGMRQIEQQRSNTVFVDAITGDSVELQAIKGIDNPEEIVNPRLYGIDDQGRACVQVRRQSPETMVDQGLSGQQFLLIDIPKKAVLPLPSLAEFQKERIEIEFALLKDDSLILAIEEGSAMKSVHVDLATGKATPIAFAGWCIGILSDGSYLMVGDPTSDALGMQKSDMKKAWLVRYEPKKRTRKKILSVLDIEGGYGGIPGISKGGRYMASVTGKRGDDGLLTSSVSVYDLTQEDESKVLWKRALPCNGPVQWMAFRMALDGTVILANVDHSGSGGKPRPTISLWSITKEQGPTEIEKEIVSNVGEGPQMLQSRVWYLRPGDGEKPATLHSIDLGSAEAPEAGEK